MNRTFVSIALLTAALGHMADVAPLAAQQAGSVSIQLRSDAEVGCPSCGDFRLLSNVLGVILGGGDSLYVLDAARPKVRIFRRGGGRIAGYLEEGRERGHVVLPIGLALTESRIIVVDGVLDRVTVFGRDWQPTTHYDVPATPVAVAHRAPFDHFFVGTVRYAAGTPTVQIWRGDASSTNLQPLLTFDDGFPRGRQGGTTSFFGFAMSPDGGFAVGEGAHAYSIRLYDRDGNLQRRIERDVPRAEMTDAQYRDALERRRTALRRTSSLARIHGGDPGAMEELSMARNHFSASALRFDDAGRLWVKSDRGGDRETIFDVFDGSIKVAEVVVPGAIGPYDVRNGYLAGLTIRALDVPIVEVFRIRERRR